jgi:outer membrane biosynthesis protein TonB
VNQLVLLTLQLMLVLVVFLILIELLRLQRAVRSAQLLLPDLDEVQRMNETIRGSSADAERASRTLTESLERLRAESKREEPIPETRPEPQPEFQPEPEPEPEPETKPAPVWREPEKAQIEGSTRRGPRVLSEAGRAKFDRVLHLAARGLDIDSIASEVDLTRAEIELMLGSAG